MTCGFQVGFQDPGFQTTCGPAAPSLEGGGGGAIGEGNRRIVARSLWRNLLEEYGPVDGPEVYRRMLLGQDGPFAPGNKYAGHAKRVVNAVQRAEAKRALLGQRAPNPVVDAIRETLGERADATSRIPAKLPRWRRPSRQKESRRD